MWYHAEFKDNPLVIVMGDRWADCYHPLEFPLSAESSMYGLIESQAELFGQRDDGKLVACDIQLVRDKGIILEFPGGEARFQPQWWRQAWEGLKLESRPYTGREVTLRLIIALMAFVPRKKQGDRGGGHTDAESINCLKNLIHGCLYLSEREDKPMSIRTAVGTVIDAVKEGSEGFPYPILLPDNGTIPWPQSWGMDPQKSFEKLRVRVQREIP